MTKKELKGEWYAVRVHTGFEFSVERRLNQIVESLGLQDKVFKVLVPQEKQIRIKNGKRVEKQEKIYPGFVLINMLLEDQVWYVINNADHVNGFVGSRTQAQPLSSEEMDSIMKRINSQEAKNTTDIKVGDAVRIIDGPFANLDGKVGEITDDKKQVTIYVPMFGRDTPVKLDIFQVRRL